MEDDKNFIGEELTGDFEGRQAEEGDISGIQDLLKQLFLTGHVDCFELAKIIVSQNYIGFVLKQILDFDEDDEEEDGDDDGFPTLAVCTIININNKKDDTTIRSLKEFLLKKSQQHNQQHHQQLQDLFADSTNMGILINEKFLPDPKVAHPSLESLCHDMEKAVKKGMDYNFDKILIYSKTYTELHNKNKNKNNNKNSNNNTNNKTRSYSDEELEFYNPEDKIFYQYADWKFTFSVLGEHDSLIDMTSQEAMANQQEPLRTLMLISADKMSAILESIKENL